VTQDTIEYVSPILLSAILMQISIVAIHGIGAHPDDTWTKRVETEDGKAAYISWLTEGRMLPAVATNARIMRYGYKSNWFGKKPMQAKVRDVATRLLNSLTMYREVLMKLSSKGAAFAKSSETGVQLSPADLHYPLLWRPHCTQGKKHRKVHFDSTDTIQASVLARNDEEDWRPIFKSTIGLLTLGTPFRGADGMQYREIVEAALREYTEDEVRAETIDVLQRENETLNDLVTEFCKIHKREGHAQIACFYETGYTDVGKVVGGEQRIVSADQVKGMTILTHLQRLLVTESSGRLDFADNGSIARDHFEMNKFEEPGEEDFMLVMKALKKMIKGANARMLSLSASGNAE